MRRLSKIRELLDGASPLSVFACDNIKEARQAFYRLRKKFDFPYWAATDFKIKDISNPGRIVTLRLNPYQRKLAETFNIRLNAGLPGKYIISKTTPRCGLTTFIQAYILWMQTNGFHRNYIMFTNSSRMEDELKNNVSRSFDATSSDPYIHFPKQKIYVFNQIEYSQQDCRHFPSAYIHLSDMDKWYDPDGNNTSGILSSALINWIDSPSSLIILEGDCNLPPNFRTEDYQNYHIPEYVRMMQLSAFTSNPFFLNRIIIASDTRILSDYHHIHLHTTLPSGLAYSDN